jgi:hypothetical protein
MTARRKILSRALALAALTVFAGAAVANASPSRTHHEKHLVGRVAAISATGFTIDGRVLTATSRQLAGLVEGQCVEAKTRLSQGALQVVRISREDRCAPLTTAPSTTTTTPVAADDPAQHDLGDDHATGGGVDDRASQIAGDDHGHHGNDD